jgi:hypothetical protein
MHVKKSVVFGLNLRLHVTVSSWDVMLYFWGKNLTFLSLTRPWTLLPIMFEEGKMEDGAVASIISLSPASHARVFAVPYMTVHFLSSVCSECT